MHSFHPSEACWPAGLLSSRDMQLRRSSRHPSCHLRPSHRSHSNPGHLGNRFPKHCHHSATPESEQGHNCSGSIPEHVQLSPLHYVGRTKRQLAEAVDRDALGLCVREGPKQGPVQHLGPSGSLHTLRPTSGMPRPSVTSSSAWVYDSCQNQHPTTW